MQRKTCSACGRRRRPSAYTYSSLYNGRPHGRCDDCQRARIRDDNLRQRYGISVADYEEMIERQDGKCPVCLLPLNEETELRDNRRHPVDHCHSCGQVRGVTCNQCNLIIGWASDERERFLSAADYVYRHTQWCQPPSAADNASQLET